MGAGLLQAVLAVAPAELQQAQAGTVAMLGVGAVLQLPLGDLVEVAGGSRQGR